MDVYVAPMVNYAKLWLLQKETPKGSGKWHRKVSKDKLQQHIKTSNNGCSLKRNVNTDPQYIAYHTSYCVAVGLLPFHESYLEKQPPQPKIFDFLSDRSDP